MKSRWGTSLGAIAVFALLLGAARGAAQAHAEQEARTSGTENLVVAVRIVTEDGRVLSESPPGIAVEIGKPPDRERIARSIRVLYGTGDYAHLKAGTTPGGSGVRLDYVV